MDHQRNYLSGDIRAGRILGFADDDNVCAIEIAEDGTRMKMMQG